MCSFFQALVKNKPVNTGDSAVSVRRFGSFGLLQMLGIDVDKEGEKCHRWYEYSCKHCPAFQAKIRYYFLLSWKTNYSLMPERASTLRFLTKLPVMG